MSLWPNFFIVGAQKAGTTSIFEWLKRHPDIFVPRMKETHFFSSDLVIVDSDQVIRKESEYLALFRSGWKYRVIGEASPSYLWHELVAERIWEKNKAAKFLILLRDPVERAFSSYLMDVLDGHCNRPFFETICDQITNPVHLYGRGYPLIELGFYYTQITRYLSRFDKGSVLIVLFEDLIRDPVGSFKTILTFLSLEFPDESAQFKAHNQYRKPKFDLLVHLMHLRRFRIWWRATAPNYVRQLVRKHFLTQGSPKPEIDPRVFDLLQPIYEPEIAKLEDLMKRPFPELRKSWQTCVESST